MDGWADKQRHGQRFFRMERTESVELQGHVSVLYALFHEGRIVLNVDTPSPMPCYEEWRRGGVFA